jgi:hypothetical protein
LSIKAPRVYLGHNYRSALAVLPLSKGRIPTRKTNYCIAHAGSQRNGRFPLRYFLLCAKARRPHRKRLGTANGARGSGAWSSNTRATPRSVSFRCPVALSISTGFALVMAGVRDCDGDAGNYGQSPAFNWQFGGNSSASNCCPERWLKPADARISATLAVIGPPKLTRECPFLAGSAKNKASIVSRVPEFPNSRV